MTILFANKASSKLAAGITDSATTLTVASGDGAEFPLPTGGDEFRCVLFDTAGNFEIIKVTTRATDAFSVIVRAQEGTTAQAWLADDGVSLRTTKETLESFQGDLTTHEADTTTHGATGAVVGTTNTQTLSAKTLDDVVLTGSIDEEVYAISSSSTPNVDPANGTIQTFAFTQTSDVSNSLSDGESVTLLISAGVSYTVTWTSIIWIGTGGTAPVLTAFDVVELWKVGTNTYGAYVGSAA